MDDCSEEKGSAALRLVNSLPGASLAEVAGDCCLRLSKAEISVQDLLREGGIKWAVFGGNGPPIWAVSELTERSNMGVVWRLQENYRNFNMLGMNENNQQMLEFIDLDTSLRQLADIVDNVEISAPEIESVRFVLKSAFGQTVDTLGYSGDGGCEWPLRAMAEGRICAVATLKGGVTDLKSVELGLDAYVFPSKSYLKLIKRVDSGSVIRNRRGLRFVNGRCMTERPTISISRKIHSCSCAETNYPRIRYY